MTQSWKMTRLWLLAAAACCAMALDAQVTADEPVTVSTEHPRLILRPQRLRLLKRERERTSHRWQQFETFVAGNAPMPERAFAYALYYQISGDEAFGKKAVEAALAAGADLRQQALVFDWCQPVLTEPQKRALTARLEKGIADPAANDSMASVRSRVFAAVVLFDHVEQAPQRELQRVVRSWWLGKIVPALRSGRNVISRDDAYPLLELLHAIRDNTLLELRESFPKFFRDYAIEHLLSYYPAVYPGPDGDFYVGAMRSLAEPDLRAAALSRAAEFAIVAYEINGAESQVLQGWLMHDKYVLRGTFGAPYEFLWANPYQPGLSYYHVPLIYHNPEFGKLFVRSSWDNTAQWLGAFDGVVQMFEEGHLRVIDPKTVTAPFSMKEALFCFAAASRKFRFKLDEETAVFLMGLKPRSAYRIEIDDEEMFEAKSDAAGILALTEVTHGKEIGLRLSDAPQP
jgi:hypothetical protein